MQINTNHSNRGDHYGLQPGNREQNNTALQPSRRFVNRQLTATVSSSSSSPPNLLDQPRGGGYSSYTFQNANLNHQVIRAYQQSARFEEGPFVPLDSNGNILGQEARGNEGVLAQILREEPENSAAWYDLGILYHQQGSRDKVSAVYQILQKLDGITADHFSVQLGLNEKLLLDIV